MQYGTVLSPHLSPLQPEVALLKGKLELMEGWREITLVWLWPSPQDDTLRLFTATWWMSVKVPGLHKSLSFLNAYYAPGLLHSVSKGRREETVSEVKSFASVMAVKVAEEVELSTEAGLSMRLTAGLPIRPRTEGPEGGVGLMLFQSVPVRVSPDVTAAPREGAKDR